MADRVYITVASFCLVEAIEKLKEEGCIELGLSKQDGDWLLSFNLPCKKMSAVNDGEKILVVSDDKKMPEEVKPLDARRMIIHHELSKAEDTKV